MTKSTVWVAEPEGGFGAPKLSVAFWDALFGFVGSNPDVTPKPPHVLNPDHEWPHAGHCTCLTCL